MTPQELLDKQFPGLTQQSVQPVQQAQTTSQLVAPQVARQNTGVVNQYTDPNNPSFGAGSKTGTDPNFNANASLQKIGIQPNVSVASSLIPSASDYATGIGNAVGVVNSVGSSLNDFNPISNVVRGFAPTVRTLSGLVQGFNPGQSALDAAGASAIAPRTMSTAAKKVDYSSVQAQPFLSANDILNSSNVRLDPRQNNFQQNVNTAQQIGGGIDTSGFNNYINGFQNKNSTQAEDIANQKSTLTDQLAQAQNDFNSNIYAYKNSDTFLGGLLAGAKARNANARRTQLQGALNGLLASQQQFNLQNQGDLQKEQLGNEASRASNEAGFKQKTALDYLNNAGDNQLLQAKTDEAKNMEAFQLQNDPLKQNQVLDLGIKKKMFNIDGQIEQLDPVKDAAQIQSLQKQRLALSGGKNQKDDFKQHILTDADGKQTLVNTTNGNPTNVVSADGSVRPITQGIDPTRQAILLAQQYQKGAKLSSQDEKIAKDFLKTSGLQFK